MISNENYDSTTQRSKDTRLALLIGLTRRRRGPHKRKKKRGNSKAKQGFDWQLQKVKKEKGTQAKVRFSSVWLSHLSDAGGREELIVRNDKTERSHKFTFWHNTREFRG